MTFQTERLCTLEPVRAFVEGSGPADYQPEDRRSAYEFVRRTLVRFGYPRLGRADRGCLTRRSATRCRGFGTTCRARG